MAPCGCLGRAPTWNLLPGGTRTLLNVHLSDQLSELSIITTLLISRDTMSSQALPVALQSKLLGYGRAGSAHLSAINLDL